MSGQDELKIVDNELVAEIEKLPANHWNFINATHEPEHGIHLYPATLANSISRTLIGIIRKHQGVKTLLDPFMGSGTVLMEGILCGMDTVCGNDLNPLAYLISCVKTACLDYYSLKGNIGDFIHTIYSEYKKYENILENVENHIRNKKGLDITAKYNWGSNAPEYLNEYFDKCGINLGIPCFANIGYWFLPRVIVELQIIKNCMNRLTDNALHNFIRIAFSETIRIVSNRRGNDYKMSRIPVEELKMFNPNTQMEFINTLCNNLERMRSFYTQCKNNIKDTRVNLYCEDSKELGSIPDNSIDLVITSPPYGDSRSTIPYGEFSRLPLLWLGAKYPSSVNIADIDKSLLGGTKFKKGFSNTLISKTLKNSLEIIKEQDMARAADVYGFYFDLDKSMDTITRKMRVNGYQCWAVENRNVKMVNLKNNKILEELGKQYGLQHVYTINSHTCHKTISTAHEHVNAAIEKAVPLSNSHIIILRKVQ